MLNRQILCSFFFAFSCLHALEDEIGENKKAVSYPSFSPHIKNEFQHHVQSVVSYLERIKNLSEKLDDIDPKDIADITKKENIRTFQDASLHISYMLYLLQDQCAPNLENLKNK